MFRSLSDSARAGKQRDIDEKLDNLRRQEMTPMANLGMETEPIGVVKMWVTGTPPTKYLLCDGSAVSRATYAELFTLMGTTFGAGDGSTTFNLPDMRRRVPVGAGGTGSGTLGNAVGNTGGEEDHTLVEAEMPAHTHSYNTYVNSTATQAGTGVNRLNSNQILQTGSTGGDGAHNNMQPSIVLQYIIRALP